VARDRRGLGRWPRRLALAALLAPMLVGAFLGLRWFAENAYVIEFRPACNDYDRYRFDLDELHLVFGEPTEEFWWELRRYYVRWGIRQYVRFKGGKAYVTPDFYFPNDETSAKFEGDYEENAYYPTRSAVFHIFRRRLEAGRFDGVDMSPYMATRGPDVTRIDEPALKNSDECGFLEDLILEGGRFAAPDPSFDPRRRPRGPMSTR